MRYKSLPLSVRSGAPLAPRENPTSSRRNTARDWLATIPVLLLVPALLLPFVSIAAADATLELQGTAVVGQPLRVAGRTFPVRSWIQLTWDGVADGMPTVRTANDGTFTTSLTPNSAGTHVMSAIAADKGGGGKKPRAAATSPLASITVAVAPAESPTPAPTPTSAPTPTPAATPTAAPTASPTAAPSPTPAPSATPSPTPSASADPQPPASGAGIYFGVFEDTGSYWTDPSRFSALIDEVRAHNLDSAAWTNGYTKDNLRLADIADQRNFPILTSWLQADLAKYWWPDSVSADIDTARSVIGPLIDQLKAHPSIIGYNLKDDATTYYDTKFQLAEQVVRERDVRPSSPMLVRGSGGANVYAATGGDAFLFYDYPARIDKAPCSWTDFWVNEIRVTESTKPAGVPVWQLLQAHSTQTGANDTDTSHLRYPTVEEMRLQTWIALGEGAKGLWWFTYTSGAQPWIGLRDNPTLYPEVSDLGLRLTPLKATLGSLVKQPDAYTAAGGYVSTMSNASGRYVIAANTSCSAANLHVVGPGSALRDVETGAVYPIGITIPFRGGDGALYEVVP